MKYGLAELIEKYRRSPEFLFVDLTDPNQTGMTGDTLLHAVSVRGDLQDVEVLPGFRSSRFKIWTPSGGNSVTRILVTPHSRKSRWPRAREVLLYFLIAIAIVGTEVIALVRNPHAALPPVPILWAVVNTLMLGGYLIHSFRTRLRHPIFWLTLMALMSVHVLWSLSVPLLFSMITIGPEFFLFALLLRRLQ